MIAWSSCRMSGWTGQTPLTSCTPSSQVRACSEGCERCEPFMQGCAELTAIANIARVRAEVLTHDARCMECPVHQACAWHPAHAAPALT